MIGTIIFLSAIIIFLSLMLMIDISLNIDINSATAQIIIKVYGIKIITIDINILRLFYKINKSKKKRKFSLIFTKEQEYFLKQIKNSVFDKLYYDKLVIESRINLNDPYATTNCIGIINLLVILLKHYFKLNYSDLQIINNNYSDFVSNENIISIKLRVYFTIFDMLFAIILSIYKRGRYVRKKRYNQ